MHGASKLLSKSQGIVTTCMASGLISRETGLGTDCARLITNASASAVLGTTTKRDLKDNPFLRNTLILLVLTQMDTGLANQVNVQIEDVNDCLQVSAVS